MRPWPRTCRRWDVVLVVLLGGDKGAVVEAEAEEEDPGGFNICDRFMLLLLLLLLIVKVGVYVCTMVAVEVDAK